MPHFGDAPTLNCVKNAAVTYAPYVVVLTAASSSPAHAAANTLVITSGFLGIALAVSCGIAFVLFRRLQQNRTAADLAAAAAWNRVASAPVGLIYWGYDTPLTFNDRAAELFGVGSGATVQYCAASLTDADEKRFLGAISALTDQNLPFEAKYRRKDGRTLSINGNKKGGEFILWVQDKSEESELSDRAATEKECASQLSNLLNTLPLPVWWRDRDLKIVAGNRAYAAALDVEPAAVAAQALELGEQSGRVAADLAFRARQTGAPQSESAHVVSGGVRRLLEFTERPVDGAGDSIGGYALDVTMLEEVQSDLATHVAAHAEVLETLGTAIAIFGPDRRLKFFNAAFLELWHMEDGLLDDEPFLGELLEILRDRRRLPEHADFPAYKREMDALFTSLIEPLEEFLHLPDERTLRMVQAPHPMGGLLFLYEDVTDRLALERSYNTLIDVQRKTLNNLHESVAVFGGDGRMKLWNSAAVTMWNFDDDAEALEDIHISDMLERTRHFFPPREDWEDRKQQLILAITEPEPKEGRLVRTDGTVLDFKCVPLPNGGCLVGYIDVTDTHRVQRALEERNLALEHADRLKSEFIANVSYELRTPLNAIIGFTEILENRYFGDLAPRQAEYVDGILSASNQLLDLINDILDLATIEAGYMTLELESVDIHSLLMSVQKSFRQRAEDNQIKMGFECPMDLGKIVADGQRLSQAINNLVANAIQFTPPKGVVTVSAQRDKQEIVITVADTGTGIAPEDRERVFEKFERSDSGARDSGAGLGLALVKSLIELHGGTVSLSGGLDEGTVVECRIPVIASTQITVEAGADAQAESTP